MIVGVSAEVTTCRNCTTTLILLAGAKAALCRACSTTATPQTGHEPDEYGRRDA